MLNKSLLDAMTVCKMLTLRVHSRFSSNHLSRVTTSQNDDKATIFSDTICITSIDSVLIIGSNKKLIWKKYYILSIMALKVRDAVCVFR